MASPAAVAAAVAAAQTLVLQLLDPEQGSTLSTCARARIIQQCWQLLLPRKLNQANAASHTNGQHMAFLGDNTQGLLDEGFQDHADLGHAQLLWCALAEQQYILAMELLSRHLTTRDCQTPQKQQRQQQKEEQLKLEHQHMQQSGAEQHTEEDPGDTCGCIQLADILLHQLGYQYRLANTIWAAAASPPHAAAGPDMLQGSEASAQQPLVLDPATVLPLNTMAALKQAFCEASPFWQDHQYHHPDTPFFSYVYTLADPPSHIVELAAQQLRSHPLLEPMLRNATHMEWWAHLRGGAASQCSLTGQSSSTDISAWAGTAHQLHFDCDERRLGKGHNAYKLQHPLYSSVLYVDTPPYGGPTLVLDQQPGQDHLAERAWLLWPVPGRYTLFPGNLLHGVLPEVCIPERANSTRKAACGCAAAQHRDGTQEATASTPPRITLMLAWWCDPELEPCTGLQHPPTGFGMCLTPEGALGDVHQATDVSCDEGTGTGSHASMGPAAQSAGNVNERGDINGTNEREGGNFSGISQLRPWMTFPTCQVACVIDPGTALREAQPEVRTRPLPDGGVSGPKASQYGSCRARNVHRQDRDGMEEAQPLMKRMCCSWQGEEAVLPLQSNTAGANDARPAGVQADLNCALQQQQQQQVSLVEKQQQRQHSLQGNQPLLQQAAESRTSWDHLFHDLMQQASHQDPAVHSAGRAVGQQHAGVLQASPSHIVLAPAVSPAWTKILPNVAVNQSQSRSGLDAVLTAPPQGVAQLTASEHADVLSSSVDAAESPYRTCISKADVQVLARQTAVWPKEVLQCVQGSLPDLRFFLPSLEFINILYPDSHKGTLDV